MQEQHLFEYAILRVVPRVEREEFINLGVILYCRKLKFLQVMFTIDIERLHTFCGSLDIEEVTTYLHALEQITMGSSSSGPIGKLDMASRFRWLTATRSTIIQSSKVHPGLCEDPAIALEKLHERMVL